MFSFCLDKKALASESRIDSVGECVSQAASLCVVVVFFGFLSVKSRFALESISRERRGEKKEEGREERGGFLYRSPFELFDALFPS